MTQFVRYRENPICQIGDGGHFGEIALLRADQRRTANVVTLAFCELQVQTCTLCTLCTLCVPPRPATSAARGAGAQPEAVRKDPARPPRVCGAGAPQGVGAPRGAGADCARASRFQMAPALEDPAPSVSPAGSEGSGRSYAPQSAASAAWKLAAAPAARLGRAKAEGFPRSTSRQADAAAAEEQDGQSDGAAGDLP